MDNDTPPIETLWAKSDACGYSHSLVGHLLDAAAVAELIWDDYLAPIAQARFDVAANGRGRDLLRLLAGWHDLGKATPAFQMKSAELSQRLRATGLEFPTQEGPRWHHSKAGALIARRVLDDRSASGLGWICAIIAGHHGRVPSRAAFSKPSPRSAHGLAETWGRWQLAVAERLLAELDIEPRDLLGATPSRSTQLQLAGFVCMADWIASSDRFPGLADAAVSMAVARRRAAEAWRDLGLHRGWSAAQLRPDAAGFRQRAGFEPRPLQTLVADAVTAMRAPGLVVVEAPTGEGKTEAALHAAEIVAARFGCDGFVFAMPTQGTTDTMYERARSWAAKVAPRTPVSLLHGKAMANESWRALVDGLRFSEVDEPVDGGDAFGMTDPYGSSARTARPAGAVSSWLLGRHRGLLAPSIVGTIDQVLYAATATKFVMLRHAGLAGKVVIIDEVHSYDVFMSQFLEVLLRWCGDAAVPVVLMSATLPASIRNALVSAYVAGVSDDTRPELDIVGPEGYPSAVTVTDPVASATRTVAPQWRRDIDVSIELCPGETIASVTGIADQAEILSGDGGCALVIVNTVRRAQQVYVILRDRGVPCDLLHGRLTSAARAERTGSIVTTLSEGRERPRDRRVVVATQIAEQSFDIDADVLITDLAPMDLLLQRIGRLHRHSRKAQARPPRLREPRAFISGLAWRDDREPVICPSFDKVYSLRALLRSAAILTTAGRFSIPSEVPGLVERAYGDPAEATPPGWDDAIRTARDEDVRQRRDRAARAQTWALHLKEWQDDLAGLHALAIDSAADEAIVVRDGEPSVEVSLVVRRGDEFETLDGMRLGPNGARCSDRDVARTVLADSVRLRERQARDFADAMVAWDDAPLLRRHPVLALGADLTVTAGRYTLRYDCELGLIVEWNGGNRLTGSPARAGTTEHTRTGRPSTSGDHRSGGDRR